MFSCTRRFAEVFIYSLTDDDDDDGTMARRASEARVSGLALRLRHS